MNTMEIGRICIVTCGGDKGKEVVVKEIIDKSFVKIVGQKVKERRVNVMHLEPTSRKGEVPKPEIKEKKAKEPAKAPAKKEMKIVEKIIKKAKAESKEK